MQAFSPQDSSRASGSRRTPPVAAQASRQGYKDIQTNAQGDLFTSNSMPDALKKTAILHLIENCPPIQLNKRSVAPTPWQGVGLYDGEYYIQVNETALYQKIQKPNPDEPNWGQIKRYIKTKIDPNKTKLPTGSPKETAQINYYIKRLKDNWALKHTLTNFKSVAIGEQEIPLHFNKKGEAIDPVEMPNVPRPQPNRYVEISHPSAHASSDSDGLSAVHSTSTSRQIRPSRRPHTYREWTPSETPIVPQLVLSSEGKDWLRSDIKNDLLKHGALGQNLDQKAEAILDKVIETLELLNPNKNDAYVDQTLQSLEQFYGEDRSNYERYWHALSSAAMRLETEGKGHYRVNLIRIASHTHRGKAYYSETLSPNSAPRDMATISFSKINATRAIFGRPYSSDSETLIQTLLNNNIQRNIDITQSSEVQEPNWEVVQNAIQAKYPSLDPITVQEVVDIIKQQWKLTSTRDPITGNINITQLNGQILTISLDELYDDIEDAKRSLTPQKPWWPRTPNEVIVHGEYTLRCTSVNSFAHGAIAGTHYRLEIEKNGQVYTLEKTHIDTWPDMQSSNLNDIINFIANSGIDWSENIAFNCRAGRGRSVMLAIISDLMNLRQSGGPISKADARRLIMSYKTGRIPMAVQTQDQYNKILDAVDAINEHATRNNARPEFEVSVSESYPGYLEIVDGTQTIYIHTNLEEAMNQIILSSGTHEHKQAQLMALSYINPFQSQSILSSSADAERLLNQPHIPEDSYVLRVSSRAGACCTIQVKNGEQIRLSDRKADRLNIILSSNLIPSEKVEAMKSLAISTR